MTATITNHLGARLTGQIRCWMGRRIVEIETPDGTRHIGHLTRDPVEQQSTVNTSVHGAVDGVVNDQHALTPTRQLESGTVTGPLVVAIECTWAAIQERHPDVPDVVLTLGNGSARPGQLALGHFHDGKWATGETRMPELFVGGEGLARGPRAVLGTLLHEATHGVAATRSIKDTSRQGRYHNTRFRDLATELGIRVERDPRIGWSITTVPDTTAQHYGDQIAALDTAIKAHRLADVHGTGRATSSNGLVATCECDPPRKIRLSRSAYDAGAITCGACEADFTTRDTDSSTDTTRDGRSHALDVTAHINAVHGKGSHLMADGSVRRHAVAEQQRPDDARAADHGDDRDRRTAGGRRLRDASTRDQARPRHQAAEDVRLRQHNVVMNRQAVNSTPPERDSDPRAVGDGAARDAVVEGGSGRRDDPVQQMNRWHREDRSTSRAARLSLADDRADGRGVAR
jgi:hypothetical protein